MREYPISKTLLQGEDFDLPTEFPLSLCINTGARRGLGNRTVWGWDISRTGKKNYSKIFKELMISATGTFCVMVYAISIALFQYCNSFIMWFQLPATPSGWLFQTNLKYDIFPSHSSFLPAGLSCYEATRAPFLPVSHCHAKQRMKTYWRGREVGRRDILSNPRVEAFHMCGESSGIGGPMISPSAVDIEVIVSNFCLWWQQPESLSLSSVVTENDLPVLFPGEQFSWLG